MPGISQTRNCIKYFSECKQIFWISHSRSVCIQVVPTASPVDAIQQFWNQIFPCMLSPFQSNKSDPEKSSSGQGETNDNSYTKIENTTLASSFFRNVSTKTTTNETSVRPTVRCSRQKISFSLKWKSNVNGVEIY